MVNAQQQIVGIVLIGVGILDPVLGFLVIGPRVPDERTRRIIQFSLVVSGIAIAGLGVAFLTGAFGG